MPRYCDINDCSNLALVGIKSFFSTRCKSHRNKDMVSTQRKYCKEYGKFRNKCNECHLPTTRSCDVEGCNLLPEVGFKGSTMTRCKNHRIDNMVVVSGSYC